MLERMLAGEQYVATDPEIVAESMRGQQLIHKINTVDPTDAPALQALFTELLAVFGDLAQIRPPFHCKFGPRFSFGARSFANHGLVVLDNAPVSVGEDASIGPYVQLLTSSHPADPRARREKWEQAEPIEIADNVWLGAGVIVCGGVTIGADTIVGAGAVVTRDLPSGVIAVGSPAKVAREL